MQKLKFEIYDTKWAEDLQRGLEEYMMSLYTAVDEDREPVTESGVAFCACSTCENREMLTYMAPRIIKGYKDNKIDLYEVEEFSSPS